MSSRFRRGYTLVEFLIYLGLTAILFLFAMDLVRGLLEEKAKLQAIEEVSQNGRKAMERMRLAIRNASSVTTPFAQDDESADLVLAMADASRNPTKFFLTNGVLQIKEGTAATTSIMGDEAEVTGVEFVNLTPSGSPSVIRVEMEVRAANPTNDPDFDFSETFFMTGVLRKRL